MSSIYGNDDTQPIQPLAAAEERGAAEDPEEAEVPPAKNCLDQVIVWIIFTIFVVFRAIDRVFYKRVLNALENPVYTLMFTNIIWPIGIQILTLILILGYVCVQRFAYGDKTYDATFFFPGNPRASTKGPVPQTQLALFSLGDQLNAAISSPPAPFVTLAVQSVMSNMVVVYTAVFACIWLGTRFLWTHYAGISLIVVSVLVQSMPKLLESDCSPTGLTSGQCFASYVDANGLWIKLSIGTMIVWYLMFGLSFVPAGAGNVYKQKVLQSRDVDVWYATFWSGNWQIVWGLMCIPIMWIPLPGQMPVYPADFFTDVSDTFACLMGEMPRGAADANCHSPDGMQPVGFVCLYWSFNLSFNLCLLYLTKRMSASWAQVGTVVCLNLCSFISQFKFIMGGGAVMMTGSDWAALIIASLALFVFNWYDEITPKMEPGSDRGRPASFSGVDGAAAGPITVLSFQAGK